MAEFGEEAQGYWQLPIGYSCIGIDDANQFLDFDGAFAPSAHASQHDMNDLMHEDNLKIAEFFDFDNAAIDQHVAESGPCGPRTATETPGLTLRSVGSKSPVQPRVETPVGTYNNAVLHAYSVNRYPKPERTDTASEIPLPHWPIEHYAIHMDPYQHVAHNTATYECTDENQAASRKREYDQINDDYMGTRPLKQNRLSDEAQDSTRMVRARGACLRCSVYKLRCSEGRPCGVCQAQFSKAYGSKVMFWTACVSSKLTDLNIFTLGTSLPSSLDTNETTPSTSEQRMDASTAAFLYTVSLEHMRSSGLLSQLDSVYIEVLEHVYGRRAIDIHPFVLQEQTPPHMLVRFNVVLLGSHIVGHRIVGYVRFLQLLRAACAVVSFECLERAFDQRNWLKNSTFARKVALIVQFALLLEQVVEMSADASTVATCFTHGKHYEDMHERLVQYISYYLQQLIKVVFGKRGPLHSLIKGGKKGSVFDELFWETLASLLPSIPLGKPRKLRGFANQKAESSSDWEELEAFHRKRFS